MRPAEGSRRHQSAACGAPPLAIPSKRFAHFSTIRTYMSTIDCMYYTFTIARLSLDVPLNYKTQPPWEFLLSASRNSLQSYELSRLSHAANLRKEITQLLDSWLEENTAAMLARWLMEQRERPATREQGDPSIAATSNGDRSPAPDARGKTAQVVSDNFFAVQTGSPPDFRSRPCAATHYLAVPPTF